MHWVAPGRCLIAWDGGQGPSFARTTGGAFLRRKAFASYDVYRTTDPMDLTGKLIGTTRAEAFLDADAPEGAVVWYHVVAKTEAGGSYPVGGRITATIPRYNFYAEDDRTPPSEPDEFKVRLRRGGNLLKWSPACDAESGLLAYFVYDSTQPQPDSVVWANDDVKAGSQFVRSFLDRTEKAKKRYRLCALDVALNLSDGPIAGRSGADGWTIYTFKDSASFSLLEHEQIEADVLMLAGGGNGGGGISGGGGGAGQMIDKHGVFIASGGVYVPDGSAGEESLEVLSDGEVVVGEGGAAQTFQDAVARMQGNNGADSEFGGLTAVGGGYGGQQFEWADVEVWQAGGYSPADNQGSGGGGNPYDSGPDDPPYDGKGNHRGGGVALDPRYGHDGSVGSRDSQQEFHCGGGGGAGYPGGSQAPYFTYTQYDQLSSWSLMSGGHGKPCDIAGYGPLWKTTGLRIVPWYGGGGAGVKRNMGGWVPPAIEGYGGGGAGGSPGAINTGGGGGGSGLYGGVYEGAAGPAGGRGVVIVRIPTADEDLVDYPHITGTDPETGQPTSDEPHVRITRIGADEVHTDEADDYQGPYNNER